MKANVTLSPVMAQDATAAPLSDERELRRRDRMLKAVDRACRDENDAFYLLLARLQASGAIDRVTALQIEDAASNLQTAALWAAVDFYTTETPRSA